MIIWSNSLNTKNFTCSQSETAQFIVGSKTVKKSKQTSSPLMNKQVSKQSRPKNEMHELF